MGKTFVTFGVIAAAVGIIVGLWIIGCNDKPTDPPPPEYGEHLFYVASRLAGNRSIVMTFSVERGAFVDSFFVDSFPIENMAVVGDNEKLFVGSRNYGIRFYDLKTKGVVYSSTDYCCGGQISPNSEYYEAYSGAKRLFKTENYQEIYHDSGGAGGRFSFDSKYFIYLRAVDIAAYNIINDTIKYSSSLSRNESPFNVHMLWPTIDMQKLYLVGSQEWSLYFAVADFGGDTVRVLQAPLNTGGVDVAVSPDGRYVYFVNEPYADYEMPRLKIDVYDVSTEQLVTSISTREYSYFEPGRIAVTSDGTYLLATPWTFGGVDVLLIDAQNFSVIGRYKLRDQTIPETVCTRQ